MNNNSKIMIVGLDGAPYGLLTSWIREGRLPALAELVGDGAIGKLISVIPPCTATAWSSFLTGKNPGKHGIYEIITRKADSYDIIPVNSSDRNGADILDILSSFNKRLVFLNVPFTYPPKKINGVMITGMITPPQAENFIYPPSLKGVLERELNGYKVHITEMYRKGREESFLEDLYRTTEIRFKAASYLMDEHEWDLFMVVFNGTDQIQHAFWGYMDSDSGEPDAYNDAILKFYEYMDGIVGELVEKAGSGTNVIVCSDHGATLLRKFIHINSFLMRIGLLTLKNTPSTIFKRFLFKLGFTPLSLYKKLMYLPFMNVQGMLRSSKKYTQRWLQSFFLSFSDVDWSRTKAYSIPGEGQIFINLRGREPMGVVDSVEEYEGIREYLIEKLCQFKDPETGDRIVKEVFRREDIYSGQSLSQAPDVQFLPDGPYTTSPEHEFGSYTILSPAFGISARHTVDGVLIMKGPNIKKGLILENSRIIDLAPTILYMMGLPVPSDMDGRVLKEVFEPSFLKSNPITYSNAIKGERPVKHKFSAEEEDKIKERLKGLGYL